MIIVFTGHRNAVADEHDLHLVHLQHPTATWVHGGAQGFDTQVHAFAVKNNIPVEVVLPDYQRHGKGAPLRRNDAMIARNPVLVVACYDGRRKGGTFYTINRARERNIPVRILQPTKE